MSVRSRLVSIPLVAVAVGLPVFASTVAAAATPMAVFVNEIDYDQPGSDFAEFIELAGPEGASLDGWSLVLYDGATGGSYRTVDLAGTFPDTGILTFGFSMVIQNGDPDGLALVGPAGLVEFLSYGGTFVAAGGPAAGVTSQDIGVKEVAGSLGLSMQRVGEGSVAADFSWVAAAPSRDLVNEGQLFVEPVEPAEPAEPAEPRACDVAQRPDVRPGAAGRNPHGADHPGRDHGCAPSAA
jgi:uncharacterized protein